MSLLVRPAAAADIEEAFLWYEGQPAGPGHQFVGAVTRVFEAVLETPRGGIRLSTVTRDAHMSGGFRTAFSTGLSGTM